VVSQTAADINAQIAKAEKRLRNKEFASTVTDPEFFGEPRALPREADSLR
jgi:hypothetical protein